MGYQEKPPISYRNLRHFSNASLQSYDALGIGEIDKLNVMSPEVNSDFLNDVRWSYFSSSRYYNARCFDFGFTKVNVFERPKFDYAVYRCKIETNPSNFPSYNVYHKFMRKVLGAGFEHHSIKRTDCAVTLPSSIFPVDLFFHSIRMKGKFKVARFRDSRLRYKYGVCSGFSIGLNPNRVTAYDMDLERWRDREEYKRLKAEKKLEYLNQTKFEVQNSSERHDPFLIRIERLPKILNVDPFGKLQFFNLFEDIEVPRVRTLERLQDWRVLAFAHSYHNARSILNKQGNIGRVEEFVPRLLVGPHRLPLEKFLLLSFREGLKGWFDR